MLSLDAENDPEPFVIDIRPDRSRVIVAPAGQLDVATAGRVATEIDALVTAGFGEILLDLRGLTFMDSSGLRLTLEQAGRSDGTVRLIDGPPAVSRMFDLAGVRDTLPFMQWYDRVPRR